MFRASSFGGCINALVAARDGLEPVPYPSSLQSAMEVSGNLENEVVSRLGGLEAQQLEVELPLPDGHFIRGHIDGILGKQVVEIKVLGDHYWQLHKASRLFEAMPQYPWQMSIYMLATRLTGLWVIAHKQDGVIIDLELREVVAPPNTLDEILSRAETILSAPFEPCVGDRWPCTYPYIHVDPIEESDDADLRLLVDAFQRAKETEQLWADRKNDYREEIIKVMGDRPRVGIGPYRLALSRSERRTLDMPKLKAAVDVSPYEKVTETEQLRVTLRGE